MTQLDAYHAFDVVRLFGDLCCSFRPISCSATKEERRSACYCSQSFRTQHVDLQSCCTQNSPFSFNPALSAFVTGQLSQQLAGASCELSFSVKRGTATSARSHLQALYGAAFEGEFRIVDRWRGATEHERCWYYFIFCHHLVHRRSFLQKRLVSYVVLRRRT